MNPDDYNPDDYDKVMLAGRPMRPEEYAHQTPNFRWGVWTAAVNEGQKIPPLYPGSIEKPCEVCGIGVQIGPRQQAKMNDTPEDKVMFTCLIDASILAHQHDAPVYDLGNPYKEKA